MFICFASMVCSYRRLLTCFLLIGFACVPGAGPDASSRNEGAAGAAGAAGAVGTAGANGPTGMVGPTGPAGSPDDRAAILDKLATTAFTKQVSISPRSARPSSGAALTTSGLPGVQFSTTGEFLDATVDIPADANPGTSGTLRVVFFAGADDCTLQLRVVTSTYLLGQALTPSQTLSNDLVVTAHPERPRSQSTATSTVQPGAVMATTITRLALPPGGIECGVAILASMVLTYSSSTP